MQLQKNSLFQIQLEYLQLLQLIQDAEGEITPEIDNALQLSTAKMQEAGINIGAIILSLNYSIEAAEAEIKRLKGITTRLDKSKELLKNRLSASMQQFGIEKIQSPTITISFRNSEAVIIEDQETIPAAYLIQPAPIVDKLKIKDALKEGIVVPGASIEKRKNIQIK